MSTLRAARKRVAEYLKAHRENAFVGDQIQGLVGLNGKPLLRSSDVQILLDATSERKS